MKKAQDNSYVEAIKLMNWKINVYFIILLVMFVLNIFILRNISDQLYWHDKLSVEAMACIKDENCSLDPVIDYRQYASDYD